MINFPLFGGRVMYTFKKTDKGYDSEFESKMMGTWKIKEEFNEDGIKWVSSSPDHLVLFWRSGSLAHDTILVLLYNFQLIKTIQQPGSQSY